ncbi:MAG: PTS sugar transporter subunit IIC [Firmicutes bacterium]|nr:PTS sugar transporter subunit IIC [Bacillota bacterium]MDD4693692.1 PTS sugar transporter subunit IIC [Bacillota bacterium]
MKNNGNKVIDYLTKVLNAMALGLFSSLIVGLILEQAGIILNLEKLQLFGQYAKLLMGPAIGVAVARSVNASPLGIFSAAVAGAIGAGTFSVLPMAKIGEPVGALLAALAGAEASKLVGGKTKVDIILVPVTTIIIGGLVGVYLAPGVAAFMKATGNLVNEATKLHPLPMGILVSVLMGMILTAPISSAAVAISLGLDGLAAGAATVGCSAQMIGFAVMSFKENGIGGFVAQGIGTSMLQVPNIIRNPLIWIPPTLTSAILGPLSTLVFKMTNIPEGAGMGTSGLVGQIGTLAAMGSSAWLGIILLHFVLPGILTYVIAEYMRKKGWIQSEDLILQNT